MVCASSTCNGARLTGIITFGHGGVSAPHLLKAVGQGNAIDASYSRIVRPLGEQLLPGDMTLPSANYGTPALSQTRPGSHIGGWLIAAERQIREWTIAEFLTERGGPTGGSWRVTFGASTLVFGHDPGSRANSKWETEWKVDADGNGTIIIAPITVTLPPNCQGAAAWSPECIGLLAHEWAHIVGFGRCLRDCMRRIPNPGQAHFKACKGMCWRWWAGHNEPGETSAKAAENLWSNWVLNPRLPFVPF